jgi:hypothetical protein
VEALIPCHVKDKEALVGCAASIARFVPDVDELTVVSLFRPDIKGLRWVPEDRTHLLPFTQRDVEALLPGHDGCGRWYWQQLLKLYAPIYMTGRRWLQCDADIVWQRDVRVIDDAGRALFSPYCAPHWHEPYFAHARRLVPGIQFTGTQSLIAHHVLYDREIIDSLFREVETGHGIPFWEAYLACVDPAWVTKSGAAENELYCHYALWRFPERCRVRPLSFRELKKGEVDASLDFASYQSWNRE